MHPLPQLPGRLHDGRLVLTGSWVSSLRRLEALAVRAAGVELGSSCGQLTALQGLAVLCGCEAPGSNPLEWHYHHSEQNRVVVQPGAIPPSLSSAEFRCCSMPQLPTALAAASGLTAVRLEACWKTWNGTGGDISLPALEPALSCLTALESLHLRRLLAEGADLPGLLLGLTRLRQLELSACQLCVGGEQQLCAGLSQLSALTFLAVTGEGWEGGLQAAPGALPQLAELRAVLSPDSADQRLPLLAAAPRLQSLMVCASSLLCAANLQALARMPQLGGMAPPRAAAAPGVRW